MDQKIRLIADWSEREHSVTRLSRKYQVSRKTVYKWVQRYYREGLDGLKDRSRAPMESPNKTPKDVIDILVEKKYRHRKWGPKKIIASLKNHYPMNHWPAPSTVGEWFKKLGLSKVRKIRKRVPPYSEPFKKCNLPNDIWSADYKGQFRVRDNKLCYPLTITDNKSRYILACEALNGPRYDETRAVFMSTFKRYGLPLAIRSDNGTPFAGSNVTGLSRLSMWWIKLGITPERIQKGEPQQNGRHERMHRTLKEETIMPKAMSLSEQQERFKQFQIEYNNDRPHEALGQNPPVTVYKKSNREYTERPLTLEYDPGFIVRSVWHKGMIRFKGNLYFLSDILNGERVGLKEIGDGRWQINFSFYPIGILNLRTKRAEPYDIDYIV